MTIVELSQAEYARRRGVTPKAIEKAIKAGRIPASAVRRLGHQKLIDIAAADLALGESRVRIDTPLLEEIETAPAADANKSASSTAPALTQARTAEAEYNARLKQLEYERQVGKVVETADVTHAMERCAEVLVRDLSHLSARADDLVAAAARGGVIAVRALLKDVEREIRTVIAANMRLLGQSDDDLDDDEAADQLSEASPAAVRPEMVL